MEKKMKNGKEKNEKEKEENLKCNGEKEKRTEKS